MSIDGAFDSQNLIFWDPLQKQYFFYFRISEEGRATSPDFLTWPNGQSIDTGESTKEHLYTNATIPYFRAPHLYLAFPMRYVPNRAPFVNVIRPDVGDAVFMFSRDGVHFSRRYMKAFMRPGPDPRNWTKHSMIIA